MKKHKPMGKFKIDFNNDDVDSLIWSYLIEGVLFESAFTKKYLVMTPKKCAYFFTSTTLPKESKFIQQKTVIKELCSKFVDSIMYYGYIVIWSMELDQKGDLQFNLLGIPNQPDVTIDPAIVKANWRKISGIEDAELIESFHTNDSRHVKKIVNMMGKQINEPNTRKLCNQLRYINEKEKCFGTDRDTADYISSVNNIFDYLNLQYPRGPMSKRISTPSLCLPSEKELMDRELKWILERFDSKKKRVQEDGEDYYDPDDYIEKDDDYYYNYHPMDDDDDDDYYPEDEDNDNDQENYPLFLFLLDQL